MVERVTCKVPYSNRQEDTSKASEQDCVGGGLVIIKGLESRLIVPYLAKVLATVSRMTEQYFHRLYNSTA